jgi:hypothetical protein
MLDVSMISVVKMKIFSKLCNFIFHEGHLQLNSDLDTVLESAWTVQF